MARLIAVPAPNLIYWVRIIVELYYKRLDSGLKPTDSASSRRLNAMMKNIKQLHRRGVFFHN